MMMIIFMMIRPESRGEREEGVDEDDDDHLHDNDDDYVDDNNDDNDQAGKSW